MTWSAPGSARRASSARTLASRAPPRSLQGSTRRARAEGTGSPRLADRTLGAEVRELVGVEAEDLGEDFVGVLAELGRVCADARRCLGHVDPGRHEGDRAGCRV